MGTGGGAGMPLLSSDWCCSVAIKWISFFSTLLFNFSSTSDMTVIKRKMLFCFQSWKTHDSNDINTRWISVRHNVPIWHVNRSLSIPQTLHYAITSFSLSAMFHDVPIRILRLTKETLIKAAAFRSNSASDMQAISNYKPTQRALGGQTKMR